MISSRYSLEREIGRGGTGAVWLGRDEVLGRPVALKRIGLMPGADNTDLARAEREARLSARLSHAHVVAVFDVVVDSDSDAWWMVMEYVEGSNLGELVRDEGPLHPDDAGPLVWQAADALAAAHGAGIVHRDVKPSNILVDQKRWVKLTDFGIARIANDPSLTQTGTILGSPSYLAPEVASGAPSGEPADVWSLGATLYHLLSGRPPYEAGGNALSTLYRIVNEDPPRLADAGWMAPLLAATMVKDPAQRWSMAHVRDFVADPASRMEPTAMVTAVAPTPTPTPVSVEDSTATETIRPAVPPAPVPPAPAAPATARATSGRRRPPLLLLLAGLGIVALVLGVVLYAVLAGNDPAPDNDTTAQSQSPSPSPQAPTEAGMESFIRDYVDTVSADPDTAWQMLTPKFQRESGGLQTYRDFWGDAENGRVLSISANPEDLAVSYQVRFDNFDNGPGPTVLDLEYEDGRYRIDGERSEGFVPAD